MGFLEICVCVFRFDGVSVAYMASIRKKVCFQVVIVPLVTCKKNLIENYFFGPSASPYTLKEGLADLDTVEWFALQYSLRAFKGTSAFFGSPSFFHPSSHFQKQTDKL